MNVMEAIMGRCSIRKYADKPVEEEKIIRVLEAGRQAPSASNAQNWKFIVVRDHEKRQKLMEAAYGQRFIGEAPAAIVVCGTSSHMMTCNQPTDTVDCSIALSFMLLEAYEQGLGTCWMGKFSNEKVKDLLNIPSEVNVIGFTPLGYADQAPSSHQRKEINEVVSYEEYSSR